MRDSRVDLKDHLDELRSADRLLLDERHRCLGEIAAERKRVDELRHDALVSQLGSITKQHELVQERWGRRFEEESRETKERLAELKHRDELQDRKMDIQSRLLYVGVGLALAVEIALQLLRR